MPKIKIKTTPPAAPPATFSLLMAIALREHLGVRTLRKTLAGQPVRGWSGVRAREVLTAAGYQVPAAPQP